MNDLKKALSFIQSIDEKCESYSDFCSTAERKHEKELRLAKKQFDDVNVELNDCLEKYRMENFETLINRIKSLLNLLKDDYPAEYKIARKLTKDFSFAGIDDGKLFLQEEIKHFNEKAQIIENTDFDEKVPPKTVTTIGETVKVEDKNGVVCSFDYSSAKIKSGIPAVLDSKIVTDICESGLNIINIIERIYSVFKDSLELGAFKQNMAQSYKNFISELNSNFDSKISDAFFDTFNSKEAIEFYQDYFKKIDSLERISNPDIETGSDKFKESITMGEIQLEVCSKPEYLDYLKKADVLKERIDAEGNISFPLIANLKEKGNIFINTNEESYSKSTKDFVNQLIIGFSLSFPSSRIHFKLVDIGNKIGFSSLIAFKKVSPNIFLDGIVRDDKGLEDAIRSVKNLKLAAEDKLNLDAMPNIFDYNKKLDSAPMDVYLFVLVDFPSKMTASIANDVKNVVCDGKDCGVFSVIINNSALPLEYNFERSEYDKICNQIADSSYIFECNGAGVNYISRKKHYQVKTLDKVSVANLPKIIGVLSSNAHQELSRPIPLAKMFDYIDSSKKEDVSVDFDIPFGLSGSDITSLSLGKDPHSIIIGGTGSGKSNFFHTLILDACYRFSPEELNLYLLDFKELEFSYYEKNRLPHIKLIGSTKDLNDGLSILINLRDEMHKRIAIFKESGADDIEDYYKKGNKGKIARLFVIIDEIQEIFREETIGEKALNILSEILALGRACGINVLLGLHTVSSISGIDNKLMQNIANRICLKVESTDYAMRLFSDGVSLKPVIDIKNKPEKGYGVISDSSTGGALKEFRVAYSEDPDNRQKYCSDIIEKWSYLNCENDLYVVGDDMSPNAKKDSAFGYNPLRDVTESKLSESYRLTLGTNYVSGGSFSLNIKLLQERENLLIIGTDGSLLRDLIGFSLLSVVTDRYSDLDCLNSKENFIYYVNKEGTIDQKLASDLYNVLPKDETAKIKNVSSSDKFAQAIREIYSIYQERERCAENGDALSDLSSYFVFVHYLQYFDDAILKNEPLEEPGFSWDGAVSEPVRIGDAIKTLLIKGGKYGIHFVMSINAASIDCLYPIKNELSQSNHKIAIKGCDMGNIASINPNRIPSITNDRICLSIEENELMKFRPYRYQEANSADGNWLKDVLDSYKKI